MAGGLPRSGGGQGLRGLQRGLMDWQIATPEEKAVVRNFTAIDVRNELGEGPLWHGREEALYWIDVERQFLYRLFPGRNLVEAARLADRASAITEGPGGLWVLTASGLCPLDRLLDGSRDTDLPPVAFNDGKCDASGRFWAGTLDRRPDKPRGGLYMRDLTGQWLERDAGIWAGNGLGWSRDGTRMFFVDTNAGCIYRYDVAPGTGSLAKRNRIASFDLADGKPDGMTVDADDNIWCAFWDGWRIEKLSPDGDQLKQISLPVPRPSCCTFGGRDLKTLFLTSSKTGLDARQLENAPLSGCLFVIEGCGKGASTYRLANSRQDDWGMTR